ncbi:hypothetical protein ACS0PU_009836 [Formica fusca]
MSGWYTRSYYSTVRDVVRESRLFEACYESLSGRNFVSYGNAIRENCIWLRNPTKGIQWSFKTELMISERSNFPRKRDMDGMRFRELLRKPINSLSNCNFHIARSINIARNSIRR